MTIVCDVLPACSYKLILGSAFLTATETLSKHKRRLTECIFTMTNVLRFNLLGGDSQRLPGLVGETAILAVPDTGAETNVMDERYENYIQNRNRSFYFSTVLINFRSLCSLLMSLCLDLPKTTVFKSKDILGATTLYNSRMVHSRTPSAKFIPIGLLQPA